MYDDDGRVRRFSQKQHTGGGFLFGQRGSCRAVIAPTGVPRLDECLRLRRERTGLHEQLILAYKGPKQQDDYKRRTEIEIEVTDAPATELLLTALGYGKALAFDKRRRLWALRNCEVALDELPLLGVFVEIEGPDSDTIAQVQQMLHLAHVPHTTDSYASLIERELTRQGQGRREVYLADENVSSQE